jgi:cellulase
MHSAGTPQVYPVCFQAELSGSGSAKPSDTTTFPAAYDLNDMFKTYIVSDVSLDHTSFIPPGPAVYGSGGSSGSTSEEPAQVAGNGTAAASDAGSGSNSTPSLASSQQSSAATSPPASANAKSTGDGGASEGDSGATSATGNKGASTASSSSNKSTGSAKPASSESAISARLMIWLNIPGQAGAESTAATVEASGSSGDCMAQMVGSCVPWKR